MGMNIKNTLSLDIDEAVEMLTKIADSLEQAGKFQFDLRGQEVSVDVGSNLTAKLGIGLNEFSMEFSWGTDEEQVEEEVDWRSEFDQDMADAGLGIEEPQKLSSSVPKAQAVQQTPAVERAAVRSGPKPRRALPDRMMLNTTTLPLEGGYWSPAFTNNVETQWMEVIIDQDLENRKWVPETEVTTFSDLTPDQAKPKPSRSSPKKIDEDLFSELDELDSDSSGLNKGSTPNTRRSAAPAAQPFQNIPKPASIDSKDVDKEASQWKEPTAEENVSDDDWVKPSEFLKQKQSPDSQDKLQSIPTPKKPDTPSPSPTSAASPPPSGPRSKTVDTIPQPKKEGKSTTSVPNPQSKIVQEIRSWEEPKPENNATDDDWVRPSEFLETEGKSTKDNIPTPPAQKKNIKGQISRPPPKAPDAKKEKDEDKS